MSVEKDTSFIFKCDNCPTELPGRELKAKDECFSETPDYVMPSGWCRFSDGFITLMIRQMDMAPLFNKAMISLKKKTFCNLDCLIEWLQKELSDARIKLCQ